MEYAPKASVIIPVYNAEPYLLEGVKENLEFSRVHGLAKLHSYTVHHFDFSSIF